MLLIIPYAASHSFAATDDGDTLPRPRLQKLLDLMQPDRQWQEDPQTSLCMPHERAMADVLGWDAQSQALPWAALQVARQGADTTQAWAWMTPCHWQVGMDQVLMPDPHALALTEAQSKALMHAVSPLLHEDGLQLHWHDSHHWLLEGELLDGLACASLDRVCGHNVKHWLPQGPGARTLARLQSEIQMLLYHHPVNETREHQGQAPVNAFWLHGAGRLENRSSANRVAARMPMELRDSALRGDLRAWRMAWQDMDAGPVAALLEHVQRSAQGTLILCSESRAQRFVARQAGGFERLLRKLRPTPLARHLQALTLP
jgi:hypothetical protein